MGFGAGCWASRTVVETRTRPAIWQMRRCGQCCACAGEKNEAGMGDKVRIVESRPLSKLKRWRLAGVVVKATKIDKVEV